jgi:hypothetical protein
VVGVAAGVAEGSGVAVAVGGEAVGVGCGDAVGLAVGSGVAVHGTVVPVAVGTGVSVGTSVGHGQGTGVHVGTSTGVSVGVSDGRGVGVAVRVGDGAGVSVRIGVSDGRGVGVAVRVGSHVAVGSGVGGCTSVGGTRSGLPAWIVSLGKQLYSIRTPGVVPWRRDNAHRVSPRAMMIVHQLEGAVLHGITTTVGTSLTDATQGK